MVTACGDGVADVLVDALGLGGDVEGEFCNSFESCRWRVDEGVVTKRPCHEAEGNFLSVHPVGAGIGGIVFCPVLDELPEGFGVFFIPGSSVRADEGVDEGEAIRLPNEFDVYG